MTGSMTIRGLGSAAAIVAGVLILGRGGPAPGPEAVKAGPTVTRAPLRLARPARPASVDPRPRAPGLRGGLAGATVRMLS